MLFEFLNQICPTPFPTRFIMQLYLADKTSRERRGTHCVVGTLARLPQRHHHHGVLRCADRDLPAAAPPVPYPGVAQAGRPVLWAPVQRSGGSRESTRRASESDSNQRVEGQEECHPVPPAVVSFDKIYIKARIIIIIYLP